MLWARASTQAPLTLTSWLHLPPLPGRLRLWLTWCVVTGVLLTSLAVASAGMVQWRWVLAGAFLSQLSALNGVFKAPAGSTGKSFGGQSGEGGAGEGAEGGAFWLSALVIGQGSGLQVLQLPA